MGMTSLMTRFRHVSVVAEQGPCRMPLLTRANVGLSGSWGQRPGVGLASYRSPTNGAEESRRSDVLQCRHRRVAHRLVETVGAGT